MKKDYTVYENLTDTEKKVYQRMLTIAAFQYGMYRATIKLADETKDDAVRECASMEYNKYTGQVKMIAKMFGFNTSETIRVYDDVESLLRETDFSEIANDATRGMLTLA